MTKRENNDPRSLSQKSPVLAFISLNPRFNPHLNGTSIRAVIKTVRFILTIGRGWLDTSSSRRAKGGGGRKKRNTIVRCRSRRTTTIVTIGIGNRRQFNLAERTVFADGRYFQSGSIIAARTKLLAAVSTAYQYAGRAQTEDAPPFCPCLILPPLRYHLLFSLSFSFP